MTKKKTIIVEERVETDALKGEFQTQKVEVEEPQDLTFLGMGGLSGEYRFAEIPGSIVAKSFDEAMNKARAYLAQHQASQAKK